MLYLLLETQKNSINIKQFIPSKNLRLKNANPFIPFTTLVRNPGLLIDQLLHNPMPCLF